jgi:hypothetical protein
MWSKAMEMMDKPWENHRKKRKKTIPPKPPNVSWWRSS